MNTRQIAKNQNNKIQHPLKQYVSHIKKEYGIVNQKKMLSWNHNEFDEATLETSKKVGGFFIKTIQYNYLNILLTTYSNGEVVLFLDPENNFDFTRHDSAAVVKVIKSISDIDQGFADANIDYLKYYGDSDYKLEKLRDIKKKNKVYRDIFRLFSETSMMHNQIINNIFITKPSDPLELIRNENSYVIMVEINKEKLKASEPKTLDIIFDDLDLNIKKGKEILLKNNVHEFDNNLKLRYDDFISFSLSKKEKRNYLLRINKYGKRIGYLS